MSGEQELGDLFQHALDAGHRLPTFDVADEYLDLDTPDDIRDIRLAVSRAGAYVLTVKQCYVTPMGYSAVRGGVADMDDLLTLDDALRMTTEQNASLHRRHLNPRLASLFELIGASVPVTRAERSVALGRERA